MSLNLKGLGPESVNNKSNDLLCVAYQKMAVTPAATVDPMMAWLLDPEHTVSLPRTHHRDLLCVLDQKKMLRSICGCQKSNHTVLVGSSFHNRSAFILTTIVRCLLFLLFPLWRTPTEVSSWVTERRTLRSEPAETSREGSGQKARCRQAENKNVLMY